MASVTVRPEMTVARGNMPSARESATFARATDDVLSYTIGDTEKEGVAMVSMEQIEEFGRRIGEQFKPERVILFGSYAYGTPTPDSDVDLLVIMPCTKKPAHHAAEIRLALSAGFPLDLVVREPETLEARVALGDPFLSEIKEKGKVLYESAG